MMRPTQSCGSAAHSFCIAGDRPLWSIQTGTQLHGVPGGSQQALRRSQQSPELPITGQGKDRGPPLRPRRHQPAVLQARQVRAHRRLSQSQMSRQVPNPVLAQLEVVQDRQPGGVTQAVEQRCGGRQLILLRLRSLGAHDRHLTMLSASASDQQVLTVGTDTSRERFLQDTARVLARRVGQGRPASHFLTYSSGSLLAPFLYSERCRWQAVDSPVVPTRPMRSPLLTRCPPRSFNWLM